MPSAIRYNNIVQSPSIDDDESTTTKTSLDTGINQNEYYKYKTLLNLNESLALVYDVQERQSEKCDLLTRIDYKDRFFIGMEQSSGVSFTLPNLNELKAYKHSI